MLPEVFPILGDIFAPESKCIHVDLNGYEIAKNHPVDLGVVADPKLTLARLAEILEQIMTAEQRARARARTEALVAAKRKKRDDLFAQDRAQNPGPPLHMAQFMEELVRQLPPDALVFDEALTNSPAVTRYRPPERTGEYFLTRGGSLGVGIPGAIGVQIAHPDKTVVAFTGDGGSMYTIQALWTAARHNINTKMIICNNGSYRLLQLNIGAYWREREMQPHDFPLCFDLSKPAIQFDVLARAMGVPGVRVEKPEEIAPAIQQALATPGPFLIDLVLEGDVHPELIGVKCGQ
jgi:benzoylformate decarboxylase